jgi:hypothetical protein
MLRKLLSLIALILIITLKADGQTANKSPGKRPNTTKSQDTSPAKSNSKVASTLISLEPGAIAYIRVEKASARKDGNLEENVFDLSFGDPVKLVRCSEDRHFWLVQQGVLEGWLHTSQITPRMEEIHFLKKNNRIPQSTTLIHMKEKHIALWGRFERETPFDPSTGRAWDSYKLNSNKNAVFFDKSALQDIPNVQALPRSIQMNIDFKSSQPLRSDGMYYCLPDDKGGMCRYECLDLVALAKCKFVPEHGEATGKIVSYKFETRTLAIINDGVKEMEWFILEPSSVIYFDTELSTIDTLIAGKSVVIEFTDTGDQKVAAKVVVRGHH